MCVHYGGAHRPHIQALITGTLRALQASLAAVARIQSAISNPCSAFVLSMSSPIVDLAAFALHLHVDRLEKELSSVEFAGWQLPILSINPYVMIYVR